MENANASIERSEAAAAFPPWCSRQRHSRRPHARYPEQSHFFRAGVRQRIPCPADTKSLVWFSSHEVPCTIPQPISETVSGMDSSVRRNSP
ncbi:MAG: hypothetical protein ACLSFT_08985 [Ruminococcus callidus]